jgi:flagellar protein FliJ
MAVAETMLRVHRWQLEERQRYLDDLESLAERLRADTERLAREMEQEMRLAGVSLEEAIDPVFLRPLIERRKKLEDSTAELEAQIAEARAAVAAAQQEMRFAGAGGTPRISPPTMRLTRRARRLHQRRSMALAARAQAD